MLVKVSVLFARSLVIENIHQRRKKSKTVCLEISKKLIHKTYQYFSKALGFIVTVTGYMQYLVT